MADRQGLAGDPWRSGADPQDLTALAGLLRAGDVLVLSGAGLSTESGIPDYRGPSGTLRHRLPMGYQDFAASPSARRRYWARSHVGWRRIARAEPNAGHRAVAALQTAGLVGGVITQNVDGLHTAAGSRDVVELHGNLDQVVCLDCGDRTTRVSHDRRLTAANPGFSASSAAVKPDGDVELPDDLVADFRLAQCACCGSERLKPDVVFFGENVSKQRVECCYRLVDQSSCLLVLGSSLTVMSGLRFVRHAARLGIEIAIVNQGRTRGDEHAALRLDAPLGSTLSRLAAGLTGAHGTRPGMESCRHAGVARSE